MKSDAEMTARLCAEVWTWLHQDRPAFLEDIAGSRLRWPVRFSAVDQDGRAHHVRIPRYHADDAASADLRREMVAAGWRCKLVTSEDGWYCFFYKAIGLPGYGMGADADDRLAVLKAAYEALTKEAASE